MTIAISFGKWGGFYCHFGWSWRICLGWVAITMLPVDLDDILGDILAENAALNKALDAEFKVDR